MLPLTPAQLHDAQMAYPCGITFGNNPVLPQLLGEFRGWPAAVMVFSTGEETAGVFAALYTARGWMSLPHFSYNAFWINTPLVTKALGVETGDEAMQVLRRRFCNSLPQGRPDKDIFLYQELFPAATGEAEVPECLRLQSRGLYAPPGVADFGKTITRISPLISEDGVRATGTLPSAVRRKISRAGRNGLSIRTGGEELLEDFYRVYRRNIHRLGSFGLPLRFFRILAKGYDFGLFRVLLAEYEGRCLGAAVLMSYGGYAENPWFASSEEGNALYVTYLLHHAMMEIAAEAGCHTYSLGRSTAGGSVEQYKKQWGGETIPLYTVPAGSGIRPGTQILISRVLPLLPQKVAELFDETISNYYY